MSWIKDTLNEFGQQIGVDGLSFGSHGVAQLVFESGAMLAVEMSSRHHGDEDVVVYLGRVVGFSASAVARRALERCDLIHGGALAVQAALHGQGAETMLIAAVRVPADQFTCQELYRIVDSLNGWHEEVAR